MIGQQARVYAARFAGRETRLLEPPPTTLDAVVAELVAAITDLPEGPIDLFGLCSGAIVAFEVARALRNCAAPALRRMIVAGQVAPRLFVQPVPSGDDLRRYIPASIAGNAELVDVLLPVLEADLQALAAYNYTPGDPLDLPIVAVRGDRDPHVSDTDLATWSEETTGSFTCGRIRNADHLFSGEAWDHLGREVLHALRQR
jgi:surfactin synthase thioesterase subunit